MNTAGKYTVHVDQVTESEWAELLTRFDDASIYQSWSYGAVCWNKKQLSHLVLKENGTTVAMAQIRVLRIPLLSKGIAYLRWGPLYKLHGSTKSEDSLPAIIQALVDEYSRR